MAKIKLAADFRDFLRLCLHHGVRFLVIGGYAVIHHSRPRYTGDLDLWMEGSPENVARILATLRDFGFPDGTVTAATLANAENIIRMGLEPMRL